jgi:hypothetical protein
MPRSRSSALLLCLALVASGCAEATRVRSMPAGAMVYEGDRSFGVTPTVFRVPRSRWKDHFELRLELDGYDTAEVTVPTQVAGGRIVGGIFTLGFVWIFKRPTTLPDTVDVRLVPKLAPLVAVPAPPPSVEDRLRALQQLRDRDLITEPEFRKRREEILNQL